MLSEKEINELSKEVMKKVNALSSGEIAQVQDHIIQLVESYTEAAKGAKMTDSVYNTSNSDYLY